VFLFQKAPSAANWYYGKWVKKVKKKPLESIKG